MGLAAPSLPARPGSGGCSGLLIPIGASKANKEQALIARLQIKSLRGWALALRRERDSNPRYSLNRTPV